MAKRTKLDYGYKFRLFPDGKAPDAVFSPDYDDGSWEEVRVPHDWAISGEFRPENDGSYSDVLADGVTRPIVHAGRTGALPTVGLGVYRRVIFIPASAEGNSIFLEFDGIMWESDIYINGKHVFFNHFGYKSFSVDITEHVNYGEPTLISVAAAVFDDCSRWYPGAGIFRNVYLVEKSANHIQYNGIYIRQLEVGKENARFEISAAFTGPDTTRLQAEIFSPDGQSVALLDEGTDVFGNLSGIVDIPDIVLWDTEHPKLYSAKIKLIDEAGSIADEESVTFGIRTIQFTPDHGFFLNGKQTKLHGVCNHHDLGSIGAAVNTAALKRQLRLMKEMGVNAIRTSHNPPSPELLSLCDEMGFMVMDEFFDEWMMPKVKNGYSKYFREHAAKDAMDIICRDRNHPCVIMWSIGNEIGEQSSKDGWRIARMLTEICHRTDPTRPTTAGCNDIWNAFNYHLTDYLDVVGINYKPLYYKEFHRDHPNICLVGSETESCVSTRGIYHLPAEKAIPCIKHDDLTISAYDTEAPAWAYYPERELAAQDDCEFMAGEFIWTGMDYLGEPTPYYSEWPSRSSYFGVVDLAGLPKNRFYLYRSQWTDNPVLHIFPHWNWEGYEGKTVPVHAFSSYPKAELFINGKSFGTRSFSDADEMLRYRLIWDNAIYEPGEIKVVAYDADGNYAAEKVIRTAGKPHHISLSAERNSITADGDDLVYITAAVCDEEGNICPLSSDRLFFSISGQGELLATDNGDQRETDAFIRRDKKALAGYCVACVRSVKNQKGSFTLTVSADGIREASVTVQVR